jgi:hypothetical protein
VHWLNGSNRTDRWIRILGEAPKALLSILGEARKVADLIAPEGDLPEAQPLPLPARGQGPPGASSRQPVP